MGHIILLTGISGSGKTTLGNALKDVLTREGRRPVEFIDGDTTREFLGNDLGYAPRDRLLITKQIAYAAYLLSKNGIDVIVANIAGSYEIRDYLRGKWERYIQIFLDADIEDCIKNDRKGVYGKALESEKPWLYGIDMLYEKPRSPDLTVYPYKESVKESLSRIIDCLTGRKFFTVKN